jgi:hypothetical protein
MAHFEFIPIGQEFQVLVVYESEAGRRRGIRVSTGEKGLIIGESLTPEVQNYLLAEIKDTYTTWRKDSILKRSKQE